MSDKSRIRAADDAGIAEAVATLNAGGIVAAPTETVYGLAARASDAAAVAKIYEAKGRPSFNPLIVHVAGVEAARALAEVGPLAERLMAAFWPGALTLVLPMRVRAQVAGLVTAGLPTLALRCPAHPVMQALIAGAGPLAAPSANASGRISATTAAHVAGSLGDRVPLVLDAGPCRAGLESTIVAFEGDGWRLLRPGAVAMEDVVKVAGEPFTRPGVAESDRSPKDKGVEAPGMLESHYAPRQAVRLGVTAAMPNEFLIGFGAVAGDVNLSPAADLAEAAARLFDLLHVAEASGQARIAVAPVPETGLGLAINDRLRRAAAPRN